MVMELALLGIVVVDAVEDVGIEIRPFLEGIFFAEEPGGHVAGYEGRLDGQCAAAAHRVDEVAVALPACHQDHAGSKHLVQWGFNALLAIAAPV